MDPQEEATSNLLDTDSSFDVSVGLPNPSPLTHAQIQRLSPSALAYIGDAVYELHVRMAYLMPPQRLHVYHQQVVAQVRAESQAEHLRTLESYLSTTELEILKRGRNAASRGPKRVDLEIYQQATSLETLIGYLYLSDPQRLIQLLSALSQTFNS